VKAVAACHGGSRHRNNLRSHGLCVRTRCCACCAAVAVLVGHYWAGSVHDSPGPLASADAKKASSRAAAASRRRHTGAMTSRPNAGTGTVRRSAWRISHDVTSTRQQVSRDVQCVC
jgi:hypothetical protein